MNPFIKGNIELCLIILSGILSVSFNVLLIPLFPITNIIGGLFTIFAIMFHIYCEKSHHEAHKNTDSINKLITSGIYSKLRHPIYLSNIIIYIGIALAFSSSISLALGFILSLTWFITSLIEVKILMEKFGQKYTEYKKITRWRIIPGLF
jgi:protein-S-isoprenylcysteine O-methyltransferase Ste14